MKTIEITDLIRVFPRNSDLVLSWQNASGASRGSGVRIPLDPP
jgi:hypothetical protein